MRKVRRYVKHGIVCGKEFETNIWNKRCCSSNCGKIKAKELMVMHGKLNKIYRENRKKWNKGEIYAHKIAH